jgi:hypothetical protein
MVSVPAQDWRAWYGTMRAGHRIWGSFTVSQDEPKAVLVINFYVMDSSNYYRWVNGQSSQGLVAISRSSGQSFSATITGTRQWYVVLDNTFSLVTPKIVTVLVKLDTP